MSMNEKIIGNIIKQYRIENGVSQSELADMLHTSRQTISSWENGKSLPAPDIIPALAKLLGISKKEMFRIWEQESERMYLTAEEDQSQDNSKNPEADSPENGNVIELDRLSRQISKQSKQVDSIKKKIDAQQTEQITEIQKSLEESQAKQLQLIKQSLAESQSKQLESINMSIENAKSGIGWKEVAWIALFVLLEWLSWKLGSVGFLFAFIAVICHPKFKDQRITRLLFLFSLVWLFVAVLIAWDWYFGLPTIDRIEKID